MNFLREVIEKNNSVVEEVKALRKSDTNEKASRKGHEKVLVPSESSALESDDLVAKLTASENRLKTVRAEVASLNEKGAPTDMEKADSDKVLAELWEESEKLLVRFILALVGLNLT